MNESKAGSASPASARGMAVRAARSRIFCVIRYLVLVLWATEFSFRAALVREIVRDPGEGKRPNKVENDSAFLF